MGKATSWLKSALTSEVPTIIEITKCQTIETRTRCYCCQYPFSKRRPRDFSVRRGKTVLLSWCRVCGRRFDNDTAQFSQRTFAIFDKETSVKLEEFACSYTYFKKALMRCGFDIDGVYTNLPPDREEEFKRKYEQDLSLGVDWDIGL